MNRQCDYCTNEAETKIETRYAEALVCFDCASEMAYWSSSDRDPRE